MLMSPAVVVTPLVPSTVVTVKPSVSPNSRVPVPEIATAKLSTSFPVDRSTAVSTSNRNPPAKVILPAFVLSPIPSSLNKLRAVDTFAGVKAALTVIAPASVAPIRKVPAVTKSNSVSLNSKVSATESVPDPRSIASPAVALLSVTVPPVAFTAAVKAILSPVKLTAPPPLAKALLIDNVPFAPPVRSTWALLVVTPVVPSTTPTVNPSVSPKVNAFDASATFTAKVSTSLPVDKSTAVSTSNRRLVTVILPAFELSPIPASLNKLRFVTFEGLTAALTVIAPASVAPTRKVVAVTKSNSASVRPRVLVVSAPPKRMVSPVSPVDSGVSVAMPVPALTAAEKTIWSAVMAMSPPDAPVVTT